jgi:hypothetical protein
MPLEARLRPRPLSPLLTIYRRTMTMMMSIVHRLTGTALYFGTLLLTWWLIAAAEGQESYRSFESCIGSPAAVWAKGEGEIARVRFVSLSLPNKRSLCRGAPR